MEGGALPTALPTLAWCALALLLCLLALARPIDHDESQYVASAVLAWHGLPYRDFAYLQTPLQPLLFAPVAAALGPFAWPGLRLLNALLGAGVVAAVYRAALAGRADRRAALAGAGLLAACDILLFAVGVSRNDALPAALLAVALIPAVRAARGDGTGGGAALAGLLLAAAAAAKVSYALPAAGYGVLALIDRRHRPAWVAMGAAPMVALVAWMWAVAPAGFVFGILDFPAHAPADYYAGGARAWKLWWSLKALDTVKFLALGPALLALVVVARDRRGGPVLRLLDMLIVLGLIAALLPTPTWRQYLLPALPPLFVRLALAWSAAPPTRPWRVAAGAFAVAGITPSLLALASATSGLPMIEAAYQGLALRTAMDAAAVAAPVATLAPQFLPATGRLPDPRFAAGPFYFRARTLLSAERERRLGLLSARRLATAPLPSAVLIGGEGPWTSGDAALDAALERAAVARGMRRVPVDGGRFRLYVARGRGSAGRSDGESGRPRSVSPAPPRRR